MEHNKNNNSNVPNLRFPEFSGEWEKIKLGDVGETIIGLTYSPKDVANEGTIVFRSSNIQNGVLDYKDLVRVTKTIKPHLYTKKDDILICARNGSPRLIGKNAILKTEDENHTFGAFMMIYRSDLNHIIHHLLSTKQYHRQVSENIGARINQITTSDLNSFSFFISSEKNENDKISRCLDLLDERISTQIKIIEELKALKKALADKLIYNNDKIILRESISTYAMLKNGYAFQSSLHSEDGNYGVITISNVKGDRFIDTGQYNKILQLPDDIQDHQKLKQGDILISLTGNVGRVSICNKDSLLLNQRVGLLQLKNTSLKEYIYQVVASDRFENAMIMQSQGAAQQNIGKGDIENYLTPYSYDESYLKEIGNTLALYDDKIIVESELLNNLNTQKAYLLSNLFI